MSGCTLLAVARPRAACASAARWSIKSYVRHRRSNEKQLLSRAVDTTKSAAQRGAGESAARTLPYMSYSHVRHSFYVHLILTSTVSLGERIRSFGRSEGFPRAFMPVTLS